MKFVQITTFLILILSGCTTQHEPPVSLLSEPFLVIAHRGASAYAPAHTLPSYELAIDMGAHYIELDLHRTKDNELVILHNDSIELNGTEMDIDTITSNTLSAFKPAEEFNQSNQTYASNSFASLRIPSLEQVLREFGNQTNYYIEIKSPNRYPGIEQQLVQQLNDYQLLNRTDPLPKVIIQSFSGESLKRIHELSPSVPLIQLFSLDNDDKLTKRKLKQVAQYASGIGVNATSATETLITNAHQFTLVVHPYTVNDPEEIAHLLSIGADGVFTDKPDVAIRLLHQQSK